MADKIKLNEQEVIADYKAGLNMSAIAKKYNTYVNKINRILLANGVEKKSAGQIQSEAILNGTKKHPTKGKTINNDTRLKIAKTQGENFKNLTDEQKKKRSEQGKAAWDAKTYIEKEILLSKAYKGLKKSSKEGSKIEKFLVQALRNAGYSVEFHKQNVLSREKMEVDIFIPELGIAIEVDGPTHHIDLFGNNQLAKIQHADHVKNALIVAKGFVIIRIKLEHSRSSLYYFQIVTKKLLAKLSELALVRNRDRKPEVVEIVIYE